MRFSRCEVRDRINYRKNRWRSYRFYRAPQRLKSLTCDICEILGAPRFRTPCSSSSSHPLPSLRSKPVTGVPEMMSVSIPRSCKRACRSEEPATKTPKRRLRTTRSCWATTSSGQRACPELSGVNASIKRVRRSVPRNAQSRPTKCGSPPHPPCAAYRPQSHLRRRAALMRLTLGTTVRAIGVSVTWPEAMKPFCRSTTMCAVWKLNASICFPVCPGDLSRSTQHFILSERWSVV